MHASSTKLDGLPLSLSSILTEFRRKMRGDPVYNETRMEIKDKERKRKERKKKMKTIHLIDITAKKFQGQSPEKEVR